MKTSILLFLTVALYGAAYAANLCVTVSGAGAANGSDWSNALAASFTPIRGNTYYFADGSYGAKTWGTAASSNTLITIKKATVADHVTATGWSDAMGDGVAVWSAWTIQTADWLFDGVSGGGPFTGASGRGFEVYNTTSDIVTFQNTIDNITILRTHIYSNRGSTFAMGVKATTGQTSNVRFAYCAIGEIYGCPFHISRWTDSIVEYCYIYHNKSTPAYHSEMVSSLGDNTNCIWRCNIFDRIEGTSVFAGINRTNSKNWQIYGNVFARCPTGPLTYYYDVDAVPPGTSAATMTGLRFFNNTIVGGGPVSQGSLLIQKGSDNLAYNNLWYKNDANSFATSVTHDYSWAYLNIRSADGPFKKDTQITTGEKHGVVGTTDPFVSYNANPLLADYTLKSNSTARGVGRDNSLVLTTDIAGNPISVWSIGAITGTAKSLR